MKAPHILKPLMLCVSIILFTACSSNETERHIETVSKEKPFTVQITKERSYYQAQKAQERLLQMDIDAYLIITQDTVEKEWYNVMSGAFADSISCEKYIRTLDSTYHLKKCTVVNTQLLTSTYSLIDPNNEAEQKVEEYKRIEANQPNIPKDVIDIIEKFPDNNVFFLENVNLLNLSTHRTLSKIGGEVKLDMPRGITLRNLSESCNSFSEVQYKDNLFDDKVTISIMKIKPDHAINVDLIFEKYKMTKPKKNLENYAIALKFSKDILNSGEYSDEHLKSIKLTAYKPLLGYMVGLTTKKGVYRTYFVLADIDSEYLIIAQSIEKTEKEMLAILSEIGKSEGLNKYDEFYNDFYVLPDNSDDEDIFLGYSIYKLDWRYAKEKGYANWSKAMVGHWTANGYFWNTRKGFWDFQLFDLLTPPSQNYIYGELYSEAKSFNKTKTDVYGVDGYFVNMGFFWYNYFELNFGINRYVFAIGSENLNKKDLMKRAEKMQFKRGGYAKAEI